MEDLKILGRAETPPFEITEHSNVKEDLRLKYRYLDLRRPDLQQNIIMRHKIVKAARDFFDEQGFSEIETPILIKSTPEGARDFLVPSRVHADVYKRQGLERLLLILEAQGIKIPEDRGCELYIANIGEDAAVKAGELTNMLRREGFYVESDSVGRSLKAQMKYADKIGARMSMVLGEDCLLYTSRCV